MSSNAAAPVGAFPSIASCAESPPSSKRSVGAGHARAAAGSPGSGRPGARHAEPPAWRGLVLAPLCPRHPACHRHVSALGVRRRRRGSTQARALWLPRGAVGPPGPARLALWLLQTRVPSVKCGRSERKVRDHVSWSPGVRTAPSRMVEPCWVSDEAPRLVHPIPRLGPLQATPDLSVFPASPPPTSACPGAPLLPVLSGLGPRGGAGRGRGPGCGCRAGASAKPAGRGWQHCAGAVGRGRPRRSHRLCGFGVSPKPSSLSPSGPRRLSLRHTCCQPAAQGRPTPLFAWSASPRARLAFLGRRDTCPPQSRQSRTRGTSGELQAPGPSSDTAATCFLRRAAAAAPPRPLCDAGPSPCRPAPRPNPAPQARGSAAILQRTLSPQAHTQLLCHAPGIPEPKDGVGSPRTVWGARVAPQEARGPGQEEQDASFSAGLAGWRGEGSGERFPITAVYPSSTAPRSFPAEGTGDEAAGTVL